MMSVFAAVGLKISVCLRFVDLFQFKIIHCFNTSTLLLHTVSPAVVPYSNPRLTIEAETVLDGGVGGRRRRRERQGEGLQGGAHDAH